MIFKLFKTCSSVLQSSHEYMPLKLLTQKFQDIRSSLWVDGAF